MFRTAVSYTGRELYAVWIKPEYEGYLSMTKRISRIPGEMINARHHANEVSSTNAAFILIKKDKTVRDEGLEEEYDSEDHEYELLRRKKAIEELAATLDSESEQDGHMEKINLDDDSLTQESVPDKPEGFSNVAGMELDIEEDNLDDIPDELIKGEEELSLEDLIQELEATTRTMDDNKEP